MEDVINMDSIVQRLKTKDDTALAEIMDLYGDDLMRLATAYMKDEALAADIVQQVFIKLYYRIDQFENKSSIYTWLYRITVNQCKTKLKSWSFRNIFFTDDLPERNADSNVEKDILDNELEDELYKEILKLDLKYRIVIILYYYHELKISEIAEILDSNENTIKTRLYRGRNKLKDFLTNKKGGYFNE